MSSLARLAAGALVFFGVVRLVVTPNTYHLASAEALWFAGTRIILAAAGLLTFCATLAAARLARLSALIANLLGSTFAIFALPVLQQPHVYAVIVFFAAALIAVSALLYQRGI